MIRNEAELARTDRHRHVLRGLEAGIEAAHPQSVLEDAVRLDGTRLTIGETTADLDKYENLVVLGGGNAAGHVAAALESILGERIDDGIVVTDAPVDAERIEVVEGTHPLPSERNVAGTRRLRERAERTTDADLVVVVIAGGGSALMCAPREELSLADYRETTDQLLASGATIDEINAIRKHCSTIKGGQLAEALSPARTVGIVFSDVVGNPLDVIASGPTAPDRSTYADCLAIQDRYDLALPDAVEQILDRGAAGDRPETPGTDDAAFDRVSNHVLADGRTALDAAASALSANGYESVVLSAQIEGEASEVGTVHVGIGKECLNTGEPFEPPVALLSGGETTVTVDGEGAGGPNQEFALSAAIELDETDLLVAAIDTDGIDGNTDAAGALVDRETVPDADAERARAALQDNDAYASLDDRERLIEIGPTGTNVNDLRIVLVGAP
jgi:glycerate 2-kinase